MVARSELILRWSVYGGAGLLVCLVQGLILQRLDLWGVMPFLYPALAAMVAVWEGAVPRGAVYALCLGALCDLALPGSVPCFYTVALPLAAMLAAVVFGVAVFFKVSRVEVQGNSLYSADLVNFGYSDYFCRGKNSVVNIALFVGRCYNNNLRNFRNNCRYTKHTQY